MIRVLLVDDSPVVLAVLRKILSRHPEIEVAGTAGNGAEALNAIPVLNPDVICTDLHMPVMDGLELTRQVMAKYPRPLLLVSVTVYDGSLNAFRVIEAGAVDICPKPEMKSSDDTGGNAAEFVSKIKIAAGVHVIPRREFLARPENLLAREKMNMGDFVRNKAAIDMILIGASTGGPQALKRILKPLPASFPLPIICVQHINEGFLTGLMEWLSLECALKIETAQQGGEPLPGHVYFPPEKRHLKLDEKMKFDLLSGAPLDGHCPSITVAMVSAAERNGGRTLGVLLTGMGQDGAWGLLEIKRAGGLTVAQDEKSSVVYGMPQKAVTLGAVSRVLSLEEIADLIYSLGKDGRPHDFTWAYKKNDT